MSRIREKATESEAIVRNITKDIQVLDLAKANLTLSMTILRRLQMLGVSISHHVHTALYAELASKSEHSHNWKSS